jgi:hypothetical protein
MDLRLANTSFCHVDYLPAYSIASTTGAVHDTYLVRACNMWVAGAARRTGAENRHGQTRYMGPCVPLCDGGRGSIQCDGGSGGGRASKAGRAAKAGK